MNRSIFEITTWMDDRNFRLEDCYLYPKDFGYANQQAFLDELMTLSKDIHNAREIPKSLNVWNKINISRCLKGLKGLSATSREIQAVLNALADKISQSTDDLDAQAIGNALYGLQNMEATSHEVQAVLNALADKISQSNAELSAQHIGNALYGLQGMEATTPAVQAVLSALADKISQSNAKLNAQAIGNISYGLQKMDLNIKAVYQIFSTLMLPFIDSSADFLEWCQLVAGFIATAQVSHMQYVTKQAAESFFQKQDFTTRGDGSVDIQDIRSEFLRTLRCIKIKNSQVDLHGLDHLSAQYLLNDVLVENPKPLSLIITGRGSHSKAANKGRMQQLVNDCLQKNGMSGTWNDERSVLSCTKGFFTSRPGMNNESIEHAPNTPDR